MIRPVLTELAFFFGPYLLYATYLFFSRTSALDPLAWSWRVIAWLTIAGFVSVIISLIVLAQFSGVPPGSTYIPAHMENGKLVPGHSQ